MGARGLTELRLQRAAVEATPNRIAVQLREIADFCDLAQRCPDVITLDASLRWVREELRALATEVTE